MKRCHKCGALKPRAEFSKARANVDGLQYHCKECQRARLKARVPKQPPPEQKHCPKCNETKPASTFHRASHHPDGLEYYCKGCRKTIAQEYYRKNQAKIDARNTAWAKAHREAFREIAKRSYRKHPRTWDPDERKMRAHARRARKRNAGGAFTVAEWRALKSRFGNRCLRCGMHEGLVTLTADHVVPLALGGSNSISNIQPLCSACNGTKFINTTDYRMIGHAAERRKKCQPI